MFWLSIRFFFPLFYTSFPTLGERSRVLVFSLSFFPSWGDRKPHHPFVSLSLSYEARAFWKTRSPSRMLRGTQKERGMIISEKEEEISTPPIYTRARKKRKKKDGLDFFSSCGTAATSSRRVKDENAYIREQIYVTFRPPPRGMPPKFILPPLL